VGAIDAGESLGDLAIEATYRCPRCDGPLFVTGSADWGLCLTHGEQYVGPAFREPETPRVGRKRRTTAEVDRLNRADFEERRRPGPVPAPDAAERRRVKQLANMAAYRARLAPEKAAAQAERRRVVNAEWRARRKGAAG
jgi:hypothetical protein